MDKLDSMRGGFGLQESKQARTIKLMTVKIGKKIIQNIEGRGGKVVEIMNRNRTFGQLERKPIMTRKRTTNGSRDKFTRFRKVVKARS